MHICTYFTLDIILADRLRDVIVAVGEDFKKTSLEIDKGSFTECGHYPGTVGASIVIPCTRMVSGTFVAVWMARSSTGKTPLTLCEVEVYASESLFCITEY